MIIIFYFSNNIKSDLDLYLVFDTLNPNFKKKIYSYFKKSFDESLDPSLLFAYKSIFKRPDLMFFEYTNSGKVIFGKELNKIKFNKISKFEAFRNIIYRSSYFLEMFEIKNYKLKLKKNIENEKFLYFFSKVVFAAGEVDLIINNQYVANNIERNNIIKNKKNTLSKIHNTMNEFRYKNKIPNDFNINDYTKKAIEIIYDSFENLFSNLISKNKLKNIHANLKSRILNKIIFNILDFKKYKKINLDNRDEFIVLIIKYFKFIKKIKNNQKIKQEDLEEILFYWKNASWFYYKL